MRRRGGAAGSDWLTARSVRRVAAHFPTLRSDHVPQVTETVMHVGMQKIDGEGMILVVYALQNSREVLFGCSISNHVLYGLFDFLS